MLNIAIVAMFGFISSYSMRAECNSNAQSKIALLGDSMTWIGGDSCQNPTGWSHYLKKSGIAGEIVVYARSGATWTNTRNTKSDIDFYSEILHDDNVVYNQVLRLIHDADSDPLNTPDLILVFAGANDAWFCDKRPGIFDNALSSFEYYSEAVDPASVTSLVGSVTLVCNMLKNRFPKSIITLITPIEMSKVPAEEITRVGDIIEMVGKECGVTTLRADKGVAIRHIEEKCNSHYTSDGVHTNAEGAKMLGEYIVDKLTIEY